MNHNFQLSEEQTMILDTVQRFVTDAAAPAALEHDEHARFAQPQWQHLTELGLLGLPVAESAGGAGLGHLAFAVALEQIALGCGSTARLLLSQAGLCAKALEGVSGAETALAGIVTGDKIAAYVGPDSGIRISEEAAGLRLSGNCAIATVAAQASLFVLAAKLTDGTPALLLLDQSLVTRTALLGAGFRASAPASVQFPHVVPAASCLARGPVAAAAIARADLTACIGGAAIAVGMAQASLAQTRRHASERIAFGKPLLAQQAVKHKLATGMARMEAARHLVYHAARLADAGEDASNAADMAKLEAVAAAVLCADEGIQIHGGFGYVVEYHVERHYRDAKTLEVMDVGAETLLDRIAARAER